MEDWQWTCLMLCGFGILKEFRPSEPFVTEYIVEYKNVTSDTVIHVIFPISTYSTLSIIVLLFLVTDFVRHKPVIIFQALCYVETWAALIWGESLLSLKIVQILYGFATSADLAYYTYIYAQVQPEHYKRVASYTYTAAFLGKFLRATLAQILISSNVANFHQLNYITLGSVSLAFLLSLFLPKAERSMYCYKEKPPPENCCRLSLLPAFRRACPLLWSDFKKAYSNSAVIKWSIWWAFAMAGNLQVQNYVQALWKAVDSVEGSSMYNGAVNAVQCLLCALFSFGVGHTKVCWSKWGEALLGLISVCQGILLIWLSQTDSIVLAYVTYVLFRVLYQIMITIANAEVAHGISGDSCGLIFGINTFLALLFQTGLTLAVSDERGLALSERAQFMVYGACFGTLGLAFSITALYTLWKYCCSGNHEEAMDQVRKDLTDHETMETGT